MIITNVKGLWVGGLTETFTFGVCCGNEHNCHSGQFGVFKYQTAYFFKYLINQQNH